MQTYSTLFVFIGLASLFPETEAVGGLVGELIDKASDICPDCNIPALDPGRYIDTGVDLREIPATMLELLPFFGGAYSGVDKLFCCVLDCDGQANDLLKTACRLCQTEKCESASDLFCSVAGNVGGELYEYGAAVMLARGVTSLQTPTRLPEPFKEMMRCQFPDSEAADIALDNARVYWNVRPLDEFMVEDILVPAHLLFDVYNYFPEGWADFVPVSPAPLLSGSQAQAFGFNIYINAPNLFDSSEDWADEDLFYGRAGGNNCGVGADGDSKYYQMELLKHEIVHVYQFVVHGGSDNNRWGRHYFREYCKAGNYEDNIYEVEARSYECNHPCTVAPSYAGLETHVGCMQNGFRQYMLGTFYDGFTFHGGSGATTRLAIPTPYYNAVNIPPSQCGDNGMTTAWTFEPAAENEGSTDRYYIYYIRSFNDPNFYLQNGLPGPYSNSMGIKTEDPATLEHYQWYIIPYSKGGGRFCLLNKASGIILGADHRDFVDGDWSHGFREHDGVPENCQKWESWTFYSFSGNGGPALKQNGFGLVPQLTGTGSGRPVGPQNARPMPTDKALEAGIREVVQDCLWSDWSATTPCCEGEQYRVRSALSGMCLQKDAIEVLSCENIASCDQTNAPTKRPTNAPTGAPVAPPTKIPTKSPSDAPSDAPSDEPSDEPSDLPSSAPTDTPTKSKNQSIFSDVTENNPFQKPNDGEESASINLVPSKLSWYLVGAGALIASFDLLAHWY